MGNIGKPAPLREDGFWAKDLDLDEGVFEYAARQGKTLSMVLEEHRAKKIGEESPYLGLIKSEVLAKKAEIRKSGREAPLTALEACYKQLGIQTTGSFTDRVEKFYDFSDGDIIFAELWSDRAHYGMLKTSFVPDFVMEEIVIDADNFHKLYIETLEQNRQLKRVGEYEEFPEIQIKVAEQAVKLQNFGAYVTISYKAMKQQRINAFTPSLELIGLQIDVDRFDDLVRTLRLGDGNSNTPGTTVTTVASGTIGTRDVINWATALPTPYKLNKAVGKKALLQEYMVTLADFDNPGATWNYIGTHYKPEATFLPVHYEWDRTSIPTDNFLGIDSRFAIQHITNGAVLVETEKVIRQQFKGTAISHADCFSIFDKNAIAIFDETH